MGEILFPRQTLPSVGDGGKLTAKLMETRAPYALIGLFVIAMITAVFGFVYWLHNTAGLGERTLYRVRFETPVSGLLTGAAVLFNGIRVGEVTNLRLDPDDPKRVTATIAVSTTTPVRADTLAGLEFQGLTGVPVIALEGGTTAAPRLTGPAGEPPLLRADPAASRSMTDAARQALTRVDAVLSENSDAFKSAIANLNTFTGALARNSDKVNGIIAGLERMTGGSGPKAMPVFYDLVAPRNFPATARPSKNQIVIPEPTVLTALDTPRIIAPESAENPPAETVQWRDNIPKLVQAGLIASFENSNYFAAVARPTEGFDADDQLLIDLRNFQVVAAPGAAANSPKGVAQVEFTAKILGKNGKIIGSRTFEATMPATETDSADAAMALSKAFAKAATDLVIWTKGLI